MKTLATVFAILGLLVGQAGAAEILFRDIGFLPPGSSVTGGRPLLPTPFPGNDTGVAGTDPNPSGNVIVINKVFGTLVPLFVLYGVRNDPPDILPITEYFFQETVTNNTGVDWTDYHITLGFGFGAFGGAFMMSVFDDGLNFDIPTMDPMPTASTVGGEPVFASLVHGDDQISWRVGTVPNRATVTFTYSIDVPHSNAMIPRGFLTLDQDGNIIGYDFAVRQQPTIIVPVSSTFTLVGLGTFSLLGYRWWRRKHDPSSEPTSTEMVWKMSRSPSLVECRVWKLGRSVDRLRGAQ